MEDRDVLEWAYRGRRAMNTAVPREFIGRQLRGNLNSAHLIERYQSKFAIEYLKRCIGANQNISDVFATYFCDSHEEIFTARKSAGNTQYFGDDNKKGYGEFLHPVKRQLIDRALALYYLSDKAGVVHLDRLDSSNKLIIGDDAK